jgi:solute carrier family 12 sodium/potassium/chloride transporter 2
MTLISAYGPLNYAGCFAATLSTALASYISCPKLMQVIGDDRLYPHWMVGFMTKGYGKQKEPHFAYLFTFFVSISFILIGMKSLIILEIIFEELEFYICNFSSVGRHRCACS